MLAILAVAVPGSRANPDGARPFTYNALRQRMDRWNKAIDLRDPAGRPMRVSAHAFGTPSEHARSTKVCPNMSCSDSSGTPALR